MNISEELIRQIVTKVLQEAGGLCQPAFEKHVDPSGIISIQTATVRCEPFEQDGVSLKDVVTPEISFTSPKTATSISRRRTMPDMRISYIPQTGRRWLDAQPFHIGCCLFKNLYHFRWS